MKVTRTNPCHDCAFRRNSRPGWTGEATSTTFLTDVIDGDGDEPCHTAVNYKDPDWRDKLDDVPFCAGALIFLRNMMKEPRDPERADIVRQVDRCDNVFNWPSEFLTHHLGREVTNLEAWGLLQAERNKRFADIDEPDQ